MALTHKVTIIVVEARDLLAADRCGTSDPYVKILATAGVSPSKEGAKLQTAVKPKTLTPRWDETFSLCVASFAHYFHIEVYDHDKVGEHDKIGHCKLEIGPLMSQPEHDLWLPLKVGKGKNKCHKGDIHIKVFAAWCVLPPVIAAGLWAVVSHPEETLTLRVHWLRKSGYIPHALIGWCAVLTESGAMIAVVRDQKDSPNALSPVRTGTWPPIELKIDLLRLPRTADIVVVGIKDFPSLPAHHNKSMDTIWLDVEDNHTKMTALFFREELKKIDSENVALGVFRKSKAGVWMFTHVGRKVVSSYPHSYLFDDRADCFFDIAKEIYLPE